MDNNMNPNPNPTGGLKLAGQDNQMPNPATDMGNQMYGQAQDAANQVYGQGQNMYGQAQDMSNQVYGQAQNVYGQAQDMGNQVYGQGQNMYGQAQNVYGQGQNMYGQAGNAYGQGMYGGFQQASGFGGNGGGMNVPPKKKSTGKIVGIIAICLAAIALVVCGILFIPKLFKSDKERVEEAIEATLGRKTTFSAFDEYVGAEEINKKYLEQGGKIAYDFTVNSLIGVPEMQGFGFDIDSARDVAAKKTATNVNFNMQGNSLFNLTVAADEEKTYCAAPDVIDGYFSLPNKDMLRKLQESPLGKASHMYGMPERDVDYFTNNTTTFFLDDALFQSDLWKKASVKSSGLKSVNIGGKDVKAKKYAVTFKEKDLEQAISDVFKKYMDGILSNPEYMQQLGLDEATAQQAISYIESMVPMFVDGDVTINVFVKDGVVISVSLNDSLTIMGSTMEYGFFINNYDGVSEGSLTMTAAGQTIGLNYELKSEGNKMDGSFKVYGAGKSLGATLHAELNGDTITATVDASDFNAKVNMSGKVKDVAKGSAYTLDFDKISVELDGVTVLDASMVLAMDTANKEVVLPSGKEYDLTTMTEDDFTGIISDNQARIQEWLTMLQQNAGALGNLFGGGEVELPDPDPDPDTTTEEATTEKGNENKSDTLKAGDHEYKINAVDGFEISYGCEYFVDLDNKSVMVEYMLKEGTDEKKIVEDMVSVPESEEFKDISKTDAKTITVEGMNVVCQTVSYEAYGTKITTFCAAAQVEPGVCMVITAYDYSESIKSEEDFAKFLDPKFYTKVK